MQCQRIQPCVVIENKILPQSSPQVAIKIMVLPSHMSGQEKREKMLIMEAAISSAMSHPNIVHVSPATLSISLAWR